jgi:hypothetical protein
MNSRLTSDAHGTAGRATILFAFLLGGIAQSRADQENRGRWYGETVTMAPFHVNSSDSAYYGHIAATDWAMQTLFSQATAAQAQNADNMGSPVIPPIPYLPPPPYVPNFNCIPITIAGVTTSPNVHGATFTLYPPPSHASGLYIQSLSYNVTFTDGTHTAFAWSEYSVVTFNPFPQTSTFGSPGGGQATSISDDNQLNGNANRVFAVGPNAGKPVQTVTIVVQSTFLVGQALPQGQPWQPIVGPNGAVVDTTGWYARMGVDPLVYTGNQMTREVQLTCDYNGNVVDVHVIPVDSPSNCGTVGGN